MGNDVTQVKLGDVCEFLGGFAFKSEDLNDSGGIPVVKIKNVNHKIVTLDEVQFFPINKVSDKHSKFLLQSGDVLIAMTGQGSVGRVGRFYSNGERVLLNQRVGKFLPKETLDLGYLYYILSSEQYEKILFNSASGSGQPNLSPDIIKSVLIPYVPFVEQKKISRVLAALDKKITLNRQINQTLEQMAQTLFKSWFVDFDPVIDNALNAGNEIPELLQARAELRQKVRASQDFQPLPADVRALFPAEFEESELGWVPKGWEISTAGDEFVIKGGSTPSTASPEFWDGTIHWTSPKDLSSNETKILLDTSRKITNAGLNKISSGLLPINTVLMSSRAPVGYLALAKVPLAINQGYIAIPSAKTLSSEYIIHWLESAMDEIKGMAGGTTFAEISKSTFKTINLIIPTLKVVNEFTDIVQSKYSLITNNVQEISLLTQLRDTLLPKLISGELRLDDLPDEVVTAVNE